MKSKLEMLFDDESFARDSISNDNGIMINDEGEWWIIWCLNI